MNTMGISIKFTANQTRSKELKIQRKKSHCLENPSPKKVALMAKPVFIKEANI
jgi:hypothetical protein